MRGEEMQREGTGKDRKGPKGTGQQRSVAGDGIGWPAVCMGGDRARLSFPSQAPREHRLPAAQAKYRIRGPQHTDREERWKIDCLFVCIMVIIIPEEPSWAFHLRLTRTRETATFGFSFQEFVSRRDRKGWPTEGRLCYATLHVCMCRQLLLLLF